MYFRRSWGPWLGYCTYQQRSGWRENEYLHLSPGGAPSETVMWPSGWVTDWAPETFILNQWTQLNRSPYSKSNQNNVPCMDKTVKWSSTHLSSRRASSIKVNTKVMVEQWRGSELLSGWFPTGRSLMTGGLESKLLWGWGGMTGDIDFFFWWRL